ncbi:MAG: hypothetical protein U0936_22525 [Planctomycetaceae bacterium]
MTTEVVPRRIRSRRTLWLFRLVLALILYGFVEIISLGTLRLIDVNATLPALKSWQKDVASGQNVTDGAFETIHPYLGWVHNPQNPGAENVGQRSTPVNRLGFRDDGESVYRRADDLFIVGIAGGSVAFQFSWMAEDLLKQRLAEHPRVQGRRIQFVRLALSGYKQPQQLMAYSYLKALGAEFDLIINIDGFNETVLAMEENAVSNTALVYPRSWQARSLVIVDPRNSADSAKLLSLKGKRQNMARDILASSFRWSPLLNLVWYLRDHKARNELTDLGFEISRSQRTSFIHHGPDNPQPKAEIEDESIAIWQRCSLAMHQLCQANGTLYLHVLQPNQYVPGSKPLSDFETEKCVDPGGPIEHVVKSLFPRLIEKGREMEARGLAFSDQTQVFSGVTQSLYVDPWCHFNEEGNRLLCEAIVPEIRELLDQQQPLPVPKP